MRQTDLQTLKYQAQDFKHRVQAWDAQREGIPGEHWVALAAGLAVFMGTRRSPSIAVKIAGAVVGSMLVVRAATGRDGLAQKRWLPL